MTRKDYVRIAAAIKEARERIVNVNTTNGGARGVPFDNSLFGLQIAAEAIASELAADNPRFDVDRFMRAAGQE